MSIEKRLPNLGLDDARVAIVLVAYIDFKRVRYWEQERWSMCCKPKAMAQAAIWNQLGPSYGGEIG